MYIKKKKKRTAFAGRNTRKTDVGVSDLLAIFNIFFYVFWEFAATHLTLSARCTFNIVFSPLSTRHPKHWLFRFEIPVSSYWLSRELRFPRPVYFPEISFKFQIIEFFFSSSLPDPLVFNTTSTHTNRPKNIKPEIPHRDRSTIITEHSKRVKAAFLNNE